MSRRPAHSLPGLQANILIDNNGCACLVGFCQLVIISDQSTATSSATRSGTVRWMSPERLDPNRFGLKDNCPTKESDCYALGMVIYEVLSGEILYPLCNKLVVVQKILGGERPTRPQGAQGAQFAAGLWQMLELCWKPQSTDRLSLDTVIRCLQDVALPQRPPDVDGDVEEDIDGQSGAAERNSSAFWFLLFHPELPLIGLAVYRVANCTR